jgi:hypothetical protein
VYNEILLENNNFGALYIRAPSLTQLRGRDTHALSGPCMMRSMGDVVHGPRFYSSPTPQPYYSPTLRPYSSPTPRPYSSPTPRPYSSPYLSALRLPLLKRKTCPPRGVLLPPGVNRYEISRAIFFSLQQCFHSSFFQLIQA